MMLYNTDGQKSVTMKCCHALRVAHNQELHKFSMNRILSQARGYFNLSILFTRYHYYYYYYYYYYHHWRRDMYIFKLVTYRQF